MITGRQIRAARSLLGWDASELAGKAGLRRETITNIENSTTNARVASLHDIVRVFNESGIEFIDNQGVKLKPLNIERLEGREGFTRFYEIMHEHLRNNGGDICVSGADERLFAKYRDNPEEHRRRMTKLLKQRPDLKMRILIAEDDYNFAASRYASYRWQPKEIFAPTAFYVFGDCLGLISFTHDPAPLVVLITSAAFAEAYRNSFNMAWLSAREPTAKEAK